MRYLVNFHAASQKSEIFSFDGLLLSKVYKVVQLKRTVVLCVMILKSDAKFEEKMNYGFKNDTKNLVNFHPRTQKESKESKEYNVLAKKIIDELCVMTHFKGKLTHEGKMI